jgi:hypothetical protein
VIIVPDEETHLPCDVLSTWPSRVDALLRVLDIALSSHSATKLSLIILKLISDHSPR